MKRKKGHTIKQFFDVKALIKEVEGMKEEEVMGSLNRLFSFGEVQCHDNPDTMKQQIDQTCVEAYFIFIYASVFCDYGGLAKFMKSIKKFGTKRIPPLPLFPVGAICPNCTTTFDISEKFNTHSRKLAMSYCISNDLEFSANNVEAVDTDKIEHAIKESLIADSFKYACRNCYFIMEYESLTKTLIDNMSELPTGYLNTSIPVITEKAAGSPLKWDWDDCVSFVLFNLHYIEVCDTNTRNHLRIVG